MRAIIIGAALVAAGAASACPTARQASVPLERHRISWNRMRDSNPMKPLSHLKQSEFARGESALVLADNAATSTPAPANGDPSRKADTVAFPNSPNGSPAAGDKGQPVATDKAACTGTAPTATCDDSPKPSGAADTSDVAKTTPTTVDGTAPKK